MTLKGPLESHLILPWAASVATGKPARPARRASRYRKSSERHLQAAGLRLACIVHMCARLDISAERVNRPVTGKADVPRDEIEHDGWQVRSETGKADNEMR